MSHSPAKTPDAAPLELPLTPLEEPELLEAPVELELVLPVEPEELPDDDVVPVEAAPELALPVDEVEATHIEAAQV